MTLPWPLFVGITGFELYASSQATPGSRVVGIALLQLTPLLFFLRGFLALCVSGGVAERHFLWAPGGLAQLRRQTRHLLLTVLLPGFILITATGFAEPVEVAILVQVVFLVLIAGLLVFLYRLMVPRRGILHALRRAGRPD